MNCSPVEPEPRIKPEKSDASGNESSKYELTSLAGKPWPNSKIYTPMSDANHRENRWKRTHHLKRVHVLWK